MEKQDVVLRQYEQEIEGGEFIDHLCGYCCNHCALSKKECSGWAVSCVWEHLHEIAPCKQEH